MNNKKNKPLVSVLMPVYNVQTYVSEAIESILRQTYKNYELIIVDDASTDDSWKIISEYKKKYPNKIIAKRLGKNRNAGGDIAGNMAFKISKGEYVARMDADDIAFPARFEKQVAYLQTHPKCMVLGSQAVVIDSNGEQIGKKRVPVSHGEIYEEYFKFHPMIHPTLMIRRSMVEGKDLYDLRWLTNNDYLTFFGYLTDGKIFRNLGESLLYYRIHGKNDSLSGIKKKFINSLKTRWVAVTEFGYKPSVQAVMTLFIQTGAFIVLPEMMLYQIYLLVKKIITPIELVKNLTPFEWSRLESPVWLTKEA